MTNEKMLPSGNNTQENSENKRNTTERECFVHATKKMNGETIPHGCPADCEGRGLFFDESSLIESIKDTHWNNKHDYRDLREFMLCYLLRAQPKAPSVSEEELVDDIGGYLRFIDALGCPHDCCEKSPCRYCALADKQAKELVKYLSERGVIKVGE
ncbi:hypothetical protein [uncultured Paraglaciecola sp.]|uniref:hypothetical protein n=1 Tax=uncultured Paraglaciecola sp. TaxID=1765024 RepID=UPI002619B428|nr:hypothetical protein [uncultured Paraglaciecola sp.]